MLGGRLCAEHAAASQPGLGGDRRLPAPWRPGWLGEPTYAGLAVLLSLPAPVVALGWWTPRSSPSCCCARAPRPNGRNACWRCCCRISRRHAGEAPGRPAWTGRLTHLSPRLADLLGVDEGIGAVGAAADPGCRCAVPMWPRCGRPSTRSALPRVGADPVAGGPRHPVPAMASACSTSMDTPSVGVACWLTPRRPWYWPSRTCTGWPTPTAWTGLAGQPGHAAWWWPGRWTRGAVFAGAGSGSLQGRQRHAGPYRRRRVADGGVQAPGQRAARRRPGAARLGAMSSRCW